MARRNAKINKPQQTQAQEAPQENNVPLPCQDITKFVDQMKEIDTSKSDQAHNEADAILLNALIELGHKELVEAWREVSKKTGGFHYV